MLGSGPKLHGRVIGGDAKITPMVMLPGWSMTGLGPEKITFTSVNVKKGTSGSSCTLSEEFIAFGN